VRLKSQYKLLNESDNGIANENNQVIIIDTLNEIAGDEHVPNKCVGNARRMMVPSLSDQYLIIQECSRNYNPDIIVLDEISNKKEVSELYSIKQRGITVFSSIHTTF